MANTALYQALCDKKCYNIFMSGENPFVNKKFEPNAEQRAFLEVFGKRLQDIARTVSDDFNLKVEMGEAGTKLWYYDAKDSVVRWDPAEVLERPEEELDVLRGSIAHEGGHVAITRFFDFVDPKVLHEELGLHSVLMSCEERPTDHVVRVRFPGAGTWVDAMREALHREGGVEEENAHKIGKISKLSQFNNLIVFKPHMKEVPDYYDEDVLKLYEEASGIIERIENILPPKGASEQRVLDDCKERFRIIYKELWPKVKELVKDDLETQKQNQLLQQEIQKALNGEQSQISDEILKDVIDKILELLQDKAESESLEEKALEEAIKKMHEAGDESGVEIEASEEDLDDLDEAINKLKSKVGPDSDFIPIPMDELTDEQKELLKQLEAKMSEEAKKKLHEKAKKILEKIEDRAVKKLSGALTENIENHQEIRLRESLGEEDELYTEPWVEDHSEESNEQGDEGKLEGDVVSNDEERERRRREEEEEENLKKLRKQAEEKLEELENNKSEYDRVYEEVREYDEELYSVLEEHFHPTKQSKAKLKMVGSRLNLPAVFKWEAARKGGGKNIPAQIFETLTTPEELDHSVTILVDLSGSMRGKKIEETFKGVVLLTEVLNRLGVKLEVLGFQDEIVIFKDFDGDLTNDVRRKMSGMLYEVENTNPGGHNRASFNDDGPSLKEASERLTKNGSAKNILIVLSDGLPEGLRSGESDLVDAVDYIINNTDQRLIGVGLGPYTEHVEQFYPVSAPNLQVDKIPEQLGALIELVMTNPEALFAKQQNMRNKKSEEKRRRR